MNTMFSPDSRVMQRLNQAADLLILNLLFVLTSLPVLTIGPALAALYRVAFAMGTRRESGVLRSYLRAFRESFLPALWAWLILLGVGAALALDWSLLTNVGLLWFRAAIGLLMVLELLAAALVFPLVSLFRNSTQQTLKNGLVLSLGNLPRAAGVAGIWVFPVLLAACKPAMFPACAFAGLTFYASAAAYVSGLLLRKVFAPFLPEDTFAKEETE